MTDLLSTYFSGVGVKRLSEVEVVPATSNQHEFNGIRGFRKIFGENKFKFNGHFIYLSDDQDELKEEKGGLTWYDARENHETRTEHRLYYTSNPVVQEAKPGDLVVIGRTGKENLAVIIASAGSTSEQQLLWLFGLEEVGTRFAVRDISEDDREIGFAGKFIINTLGFEVDDSDPDYLELLLKQFGERFPTTKEFSSFSRSLVTDINPADNPDEAIIKWMDKEEILFKTLERYIVKQTLEKGFGEDGTDVEEFISYSLSVQNRRKSRAGYAFEHHLESIFKDSEILYSRGKITERKSKPDFLFPGIDYYRDEDFAAVLLTMLGVKTTAKDRWRQIIPEADRIEQKHLVTIEPAISENQTAEMRAKNVQLVLPQSLMETYSKNQQSQIITLSGFIEIVRDRQKRVL